MAIAGLALMALGLLLLYKSLTGLALLDEDSADSDFVEGVSGIKLFATASMVTFLGFGSLLAGVVLVTGALGLSLEGIGP
jgi:hypothetical protein